METKHYKILIDTGVLYNMATKGKPIRLLMWLMDKTTKRGGVLGGVPIKLSAPAKDLDVSDKTIRRWLSTLKPLLDLTRTPIGYKIKVKDYDKWHKKDKSDRTAYDRSQNISQEEVNGQKCPSDRSKMTEPIKTLTETITSVTNVTECSDEKKSSHIITKTAHCNSKNDVKGKADKKFPLEDGDTNTAVKISPEKELELIEGFRKRFQCEPDKDDIKLLRACYIKAQRQRLLAEKVV